MKKQLLASSLTFLVALGTIFPSPAHATSCTPSRQISSSNIGQLHAEVVNASNGQELFSFGAQDPQRTASVLKLLTAAVALDVLGPDYRITTGVWADPNDLGKIYLVGAGDVTLSRMPAKITSYYAKAPKLDTLTRQVRNWAKQNNVTASEVFVDSSLYGSDSEWHPTWSRQGLSRGYMAPVSALQVDAGRLTHAKKKRTWIAKRTDKPVVQAGQLFMESLNKRGVAKGLTATEAKVPAGAVMIASVQSRPMSEWISNMLRVSDNSLAEAMARLASLKLGLDGSMQSLTPLFSQVLAARGLDTTGMIIVDASGLSRENAVPAALVNDLLQLVHAGVGDYELIEAGMPVAGERGSLRNRFTTGTKGNARGAVAAKTGYITTGYSLAGFITAQDGTELIFTVYNLADRVNIRNRYALDDLVYRFYQCGANLSSN